MYCYNSSPLTISLDGELYVTCHTYKAQAPPMKALWGLKLHKEVEYVFCLHVPTTFYQVVSIGLTQIQPGCVEVLSHNLIRLKFRLSGPAISASKPLIADRFVWTLQCCFPIWCTCKPSFCWGMTSYLIKHWYQSHLTSLTHLEFLSCWGNCLISTNHHSL